MLALAGIVAFSADAEMIRRRPIQQYTIAHFAPDFSRKESVWGFNLLRGRAAMRARVIFISKHRCRLGGDCANLRPPRADDRRVAPNQSSKAPSFGEKLETRQTGQSLIALTP
jgi:hypothetical protein